MPVTDEEKDRLAKQGIIDDDYLDLTMVETPRFKFKVSVTDIETQKETVEYHAIDTDAAVLELTMSMPTCLAVYGSRIEGLKYPVDEDGDEKNEVMGLQILLWCYQQHIPIPEDLPSMAEVVASTRRILKLPDDFGMAPTMKVLMAFFKQVSELLALKKDTPDSPESSTDTPD